MNHTDKYSQAPNPITLLEHPVRKAVVIGSGSMGSGIAALIASAGVQVTLLDIASEEGQRNQRAQKGKDIQVQRRGFTHPSMAENVTVGNTTDDLAVVAEADWVVEAIFENLQAKQDLYASLEPHLGEQTILSSNTSTLPLEQLTQKLPADLRERFFITHFFNPPRVMPLVELIAAPGVPEARQEWIVQVIEQQLGKRALPCRDTPGFIANRVGNLWMAAAAGWALENDVPIELADAIASRPFGVPRTGVFGLFDYIGLQLVPDVWGSTLQAVPERDAYHRWNIAEHPLMQGLIERGLTGRTGESGFYRDGKEVITEDFTYRPVSLGDDPALQAKSLVELLDVDSLGGEFARQVFARTLAYCCEVGPEIADTAQDIDLAMELGYGWKQGPFALADSVGLVRAAAVLERVDLEVPAMLQHAIDAGGFYPNEGQTLSTTGELVALREQQGVAQVSELIATAEVLVKNEAAAIYRLESGVGLFVAKTKLGTLNPDALDILAASADLDLRALVLAGADARAISAGADVTVLAQAAYDSDPERFAELLDHGLNSLRAIKYAPFPVVAAVRGVALGGGAELSLHSDAMVVHVDAKIGFPERNVGIFPAWGGPMQHLLRAQSRGINNAETLVFDFAMKATPARGAYGAWDLGVLGEQDQIAMSSDHVLAAALALAEDLAVGYQPAREPTFELAKDLSWEQDAQSLEGDERAQAADQHIAEALGALLSGAPKSESEMDRESTQRCVEIFNHEENRERIIAMGKRLGAKF
ncbi:3-hydroxyacyl-CoA dehydrogenase/enoyl-CoA hydratase family protein [Corynebacterium gerontici]|uniref:enoyl-CoA hydratase n=1 Tax=Corynebacterium gerontici TaxID=2079234 RepID=A0A3G6J0Z6_9CORY|nr:3-hydroxyacyl-CoA dehydrogenase/enoyl-CoA hydratase family protein [Corynebacterium gerontici]AZA11463.1 putative 3-hydroxyacyl-CoA dehydrogenase [Corynebacterium gerontici]